MPTREPRADACPGALQWHQAADGGVARIRLPGGRLRVDQLREILDAADEQGVELTSRANLQIRGLEPGAELALGERLADVGLLPSATHERVRNIIGSPLGSPELVRSLDIALCGRPRLADLPGRFLFIVDDGRGDVAWLDGDIVALSQGPEFAVLLGGIDVGLRASRARVVAVMLDCAERFLALRKDEWRIGELTGGPRRVAEPLALVEPAVPAGQPVTRGPLGLVDHGGGLSIGATVPLGRLNRAQALALVEVAAELVITPWRGVVVRDLPADRVASVVELLGAVGFRLDPGAPMVTACVGRPGCVKALADVRADAAAMVRGGSGTTLPVHWSGCARRCGRPRGEVLDMIATEDGYHTRQGFE